MILKSLTVDDEELKTDMKKAKMTTGTINSTLLTQFLLSERNG